MMAVVFILGVQACKAHLSIRVRLTVWVRVTVLASKPLPLSLSPPPLLKDAYEDSVRIAADNVANAYGATVWRAGWERTTWADLRVGDYVKLVADDQVYTDPYTDPYI